MFWRLSVVSCVSGFTLPHLVLISVINYYFHHSLKHQMAINPIIASRPDPIVNRIRKLSTAFKLVFATFFRNSLKIFKMEANHFVFTFKLVQIWYYDVVWSVWRDYFWPFCTFSKTKIGEIVENKSIFGSNFISFQQIKTKFEPNLRTKWNIFEVWTFKVIVNMVDFMKMISTILRSGVAKTRTCSQTKIG